MAWPPTIPPATRANSTLQADLHPTDHNQISAALTDVVARMGVNGTLLGYTAIDTPATSIVGVHVAASLSYTVPAGGAHILFDALCQLAWTSAFSGTDLAAAELRHGTTVVSSDCFQIPYGAGTASRQTRLTWLSPNMAAGTYSADMRVFRVTGASALTLTSTGYMAVYAYPNTVSPT